MANAEKTLPAPDMDTAPYWEHAREGRLSLQRCQACGHYLFPPRPICPRCRGGDVPWTTLSGRGVVYSYAIMHDFFVKGFDPPYVVAQVDLEEQAGLRLITNIVECDVGAVHIGMPVEVTFERRTEEISVPLFRPRA